MPEHAPQLEPTNWCLDTPSALAKLLRAGFPEATYIGTDPCFETGPAYTNCCVQIESKKFTGTIAVSDLGYTLGSYVRVPGITDGLEVCCFWKINEGDFCAQDSLRVIAKFEDSDFDIESKIWFPAAVKMLRGVLDA